jgi:hypothetical protein
MQEIKQREKELLEDSNREEPDSFEHYITNRVKYAQLAWTYLETQKKITDMEDKIKKTLKEISDDDEKFPDFKNQYMDKYMQARKESGLKTSDKELKKSFMAYLNQYADLPFDQQDYVKNGLPSVEEEKEKDQDEKL